MRREKDIGDVLRNALEEGLVVRLFGTAGLMIDGKIAWMNDNFVEIESGGFFHYISVDNVQMVAYLPEGERL